MSRSALIIVVGLSMLTGGCFSLPKSDLSIEYLPGQKAKTFEVPYEATYALVAIDEAGQIHEEIQRTSIERRYHVGFVREPEGYLVAYAGGFKTPLPEGHFLWRITPETKLSKSKYLLQSFMGEASGLPLTDMASVLFSLMGQMALGTLENQLDRDSAGKSHSTSSASSSGETNSYRSDSDGRKYREEQARPWNGETSGSGSGGQTGPEVESGSTVNPTMGNSPAHRTMETQ